MKLETEFVIYEKWKKEEVENRVQRLLTEVTAFASVVSDQALWVDEAGECVYVKSIFGLPTSGDKISCKDMQKVLTQWFRDIAEDVAVDPDPDTIDDDGDESYAHKSYTVTIEDSECDLFLRIRFATRNGEVEEEMFFIKAEADEHD